MHQYTAKIKNSKTGREVTGQHINLNGIDYIVSDTSTVHVTNVIRIWGAYVVDPETLRRVDDKFVEAAKEAGVLPAETPDIQDPLYRAECLTEAILAAQLAYCPYSKFHAAYGSTICDDCSERTRNEDPGSDYLVPDADARAALRCLPPSDPRVCRVARYQDLELLCRSDSEAPGPETR